MHTYGLPYADAFQMHSFGRLGRGKGGGCGYIRVRRLVILREWMA